MTLHSILGCTAEHRGGSAGSAAKCARCANSSCIASCPISPMHSLFTCLSTGCVSRMTRCWPADAASGARACDGHPTGIRPAFARHPASTNSQRTSQLRACVAPICRIAPLASCRHWSQAPEPALIPGSTSSSCLPFALDPLAAFATDPRPRAASSSAACVDSTPLPADRPQKRSRPVSKRLVCTRGRCDSAAGPIDAATHKADNARLVALARTWPGPATDQRQRLVRYTAALRLADAGRKRGSPSRSRSTRSWTCSSAWSAARSCYLARYNDGAGPRRLRASAVGKRLLSQIDGVDGSVAS